VTMKSKTGIPTLPRLFFLAVTTMAWTLILNAQTTPWVSAYYPGWIQNSTDPHYLPEDQID